MKKCSKCNFEYEERLNFCPHCGTPSNRRSCPNCGYEVKTDQNYCPECGHQMCESGNSSRDNTKKPSKRKVGVFAWLTLLLIVIVGIAFAAYWGYGYFNEMSEFNIALNSADITIKRAYLTNFQNAPIEHRNTIQSLLKEATEDSLDWSKYQKASNTKSKIEALDRFITRHPKSNRIAMARELKKENERIYKEEEDRKPKTVYVNFMVKGCSNQMYNSYCNYGEVSHSNHDDYATPVITIPHNKKWDYEGVYGRIIIDGKEQGYLYRLPKLRLLLQPYNPKTDLFRCSNKFFLMDTKNHNDVPTLKSGHQFYIEFHDSFYLGDFMFDLKFKFIETPLY